MYFMFLLLLIKIKKKIKYLLNKFVDVLDFRSIKEVILLGLKKY